MQNPLACAVLALSWMLAPSTALAVETGRLRVGVVGNAPPMSFVNAQGKLTGFNVELANALCDAMKAPCDVVTVPLNEVVDTVAKGGIDFATVSLLMTPERMKKVSFSQPIYRSVSVWLSSQIHETQPFVGTVVVVQGTEQAKYAQAQGWKTVLAASHAEIQPLAQSGQVQAALLPMLTALNFLQDKQLLQLGWKYKLMTDAPISGNVGISISPLRPELRQRIDGAIDQIKRDGRFDRINSDYLPFRLQ